MNSPDSRPRTSGDVPSLRVEPGESIVLSPESARFQDQYRRIRPGTAKELRSLIGLSDEMANTLRDKGVSSQAPMLDRLLAPHELEADDEILRTRAFATAGQALRNYVRTTSPRLMAEMEPALDRYLELTPVVVIAVALQDIDVADGATLTISDDTHLVEANKLRIYGTGQINCGGYTKISVTSLEGL
jgi:hypothetical protein